MTATTAKPIDLKADLLAEFEALEKASEPRLWLRRLRKAGISRFVELGFPGPRDEEWRFTPLAPMLRTRFEAVGEVPALTADGLRQLAPPLPECATLVFVNGRFRSDLSLRKPLPAGVSCISLQQALEKQPELLEAHLGRIARFEKQTFTALNTALFADIAFLHVPAGVVVETPIRLLHVSLPGSVPRLSHPRTLIVAEERSKATVLESHVGPAGAVYFADGVTEVAVAAGADVDHVKVQEESLAAFHVGALHVRLAQGAKFKNHSIALGGSLVRNELCAVLEGEGAECTFNGLTLADGQQLIDNHTAIDHMAPSCPSHELYKNVIRGHGRVVFNGKIFVRQAAQKTDAKQTNQTLLLSPDGTINTKPQLEIFADDVKCTHGATVGQLEEEALFYLRARGIPHAQAQSLLTFAFANDIIERLSIPSLRASLERRLLEKEHLAPAVAECGKERT